jgi:hypothetical protein
MKLVSWPIIFLLVFGLLVQNTCRHGFAGKTALSRTCGHCPMSHDTAPAKDGSQTGLKSIVSHSNPDHPPMFVFSLPMPTRVADPTTIESTVTLLEDDYQDALPDEILKPPRA